MRVMHTSVARAVPVQLDVLERRRGRAQQLAEHDCIALVGEACRDALELVADVLLQQPFHEQLQIQVPAQCQILDADMGGPLLDGAAGQQFRAGFPRYASERTLLQRWERVQDGGKASERWEAAVLERELRGLHEAMEKSALKRDVDVEPGDPELVDIRKSGKQQFPGA